MEFRCFMCLEEFCVERQADRVPFHKKCGVDSCETVEQLN